jgi:thiamine-phosphate pyrophosphorylase
MLDVFYPIVPDAAWAARIVPLGVKTLQLRVKDAEPDRIRAEITEAMAICAAHGCQLIVNDYWRDAIALGANYIHLGQEDLAEADIAAIRKAGLKLGVSTHTMKYPPQGLDRVDEWKRLIDCPLVAIGGITLERAPAVLASGADSIAVVTDFLSHADPERRVREWLAFAEGVRAA